MIKEHRFFAGIVTLNYAETEGSGPPLVLLHGGSARWQSALSLIPELSRRWHVYAPDLRGHGKSGRVPGCYRLKDYEADIVAFLQDVVRQPAVLFGHSLGGQVATLLAADYPYLVGGLIIGDAPFDLAKFRLALQRDQQRLLYWRDLAGSQRSLEEITDALKNTPVTLAGALEPVEASTLFGAENPWFRVMAENLQNNDPDAQRRHRV